MATEIALDAARSFFENVKSNAGNPLKVTFSTKSSTTDIAADALTFAQQLVSQVNQSYGTDTHSDSMNINEFTQFVTGGEVKLFQSLSDPKQKSIVEDAFYDISKNRALASASDFAEYLRVRDAADNSTNSMNGVATINFLA